MVGYPQGEQGRHSGSAETLMMEIQRTIKHDADRVKGFGRELMNVPGCEKLERCIQCGLLLCCGLANSLIQGKQ